MFRGDSDPSEFTIHLIQMKTPYCVDSVKRVLIVWPPNFIAHKITMFLVNMEDMGKTTTTDGIRMIYGHCVCS